MVTAFPLQTVYRRRQRMGPDLHQSVPHPLRSPHVVVHIGVSGRFLLRPFRPRVSPVSSKQQTSVPHIRIPRYAVLDLQLGILSSPFPFRSVRNAQHGHHSWDLFLLRVIDHQIRGRQLADIVPHCKRRSPIEKITLALITIPLDRMEIPVRRPHGVRIKMQRDGIAHQIIDVVETDLQLELLSLLHLPQRFRHFSWVASLRHARRQAGPIDTVLHHALRLRRIGKHRGPARRSAPGAGHIDLSSLRLKLISQRYDHPAFRIRRLLSQKFRQPAVPVHPDQITVFHASRLLGRTQYQTILQIGIQARVETGGIGVVIHADAVFRESQRRRLRLKALRQRGHVRRAQFHRI